MAKRKTIAVNDSPNANPRPLDQFNLSEVYRIIHLESIPGFRLLDKEIRYLEEYREALKKSYEEGKGAPGDDSEPAMNANEDNELEAQEDTETEEATDEPSTQE